MGSYGIIVKTEEIRRRVQNGDYDSAQKIIDTMPLKKVKNIADLSLFAEVYIQNKRYDEAMELLYRIYKKSKTRRILEHMVIVSIGRNNIEEAERFLSEYREIAPNDYNYYIYRYKIDKLKKEPYDVLIDSLKKLKQHIYLEKWTYELAKLYYKAGMEKECIQECSEIILMFGEGSYVEKAKILKAYYSGEVGKEEIIEKLKNIANKDNKELTAHDSQTGEHIYPDNQDIVTGEYTDNLFDETVKASDEQEEQKEAPVKFGVMDGGINDDMLDEIADNMRKEVNSLLETEQKLETDREFDQPDAGIDDINTIFDFKIFDFNEKNEELERLDKLAENLHINLRHLFGNFLHVRELQSQLVKSLEGIMDKNTKSVQLVITGAPFSGKTTLAKEIAIFLNKAGKQKTSKLAKISASKLNDTDITKIREEIRDCCLVVENAGRLKRSAVDKILELIRYFQGDIAVILEDNDNELERKFKENPKIAELFKNRIHIPPYSEDDLIRFAYADIVLKGYRLHPAAVEPFKKGLYKILGNEDKGNVMGKIYEYVRNSMTAANLRTGKELANLTFGGRLADYEDLFLIPDDFTVHIS